MCGGLYSITLTHARPLSYVCLPVCELDPNPRGGTPEQEGSCQPATLNPPQNAETLRAAPASWWHVVSACRVQVARPLSSIANTGGSDPQAQVARPLLMVFVCLHEMWKKTLIHAIRICKCWRDLHMHCCTLCAHDATPCAATHVSAWLWQVQASGVPVPVDEARSRSSRESLRGQGLVSQWWPATEVLSLIWPFSVAQMNEV